MLKLIFWFIILAAVAAGLTWLAEHPGTMTIDWLGYHVEDMPVALALGLLAAGLLVLWLAWRLLRMIFAAPGATADFFRLRRKRKGLEELSGGLVALLAGDAQAARKAAHRAARLTPEEPMARLLEARAAQDMGDAGTAEALLLRMLEDERTEPAALHGLYEQARRKGDADAARHWALRAWEKYPALPWAARAMLAFKAAEGDWAAVTCMLEQMRRSGLLSKEEANRKKAVAFTAQAMALEEKSPQEAMDLAIRAHKLDPALIPAAVVAGGMLAARGQMRKAAKILERTWRLSPHPDIAEIYAHLRAGDSPADRLKRVRQLLRLASGGEEGAVALARAAMEAQDWETARGALRTWVNENPSSRIYQLMAEIEEGESGDHGRAREWLARAVRARRNPAWTADGIVSPRWLPVSPVSGELGAFEWKTPVEGSELPVALEPVPEELLEAPAMAVAQGGEDAAQAPMKVVGEARAEDSESMPRPATEASEASESAKDTAAPGEREETGQEAPKVVELKAEGPETSASGEDAAAGRAGVPPRAGQEPEDGDKPQEEQAPQKAQEVPRGKDAPAAGEERVQHSSGAESPQEAQGPAGGTEGRKAAEEAASPTDEMPSRPAPPPGTAPIAPPATSLRTKKSNPKVIEQEGDIRPPIPDDPGPKTKEATRPPGSRRWFG